MSRAGSTCVVYEVSGVIRAIMSIPTLAATRPGTINGFGPIPAKTMIPAVNGRNAKPERNGV